MIHDPNSIAPFIGLPSTTKRIVTIHDAFSYIYPQTQSRLDTWRYRYMLPGVLRKTDAVITNSRQSHQDIAQYLNVPGANMHIIPYGMHPRFAPMPAAVAASEVQQKYGITQPYLLYVGGINALRTSSGCLRHLPICTSGIPSWCW